MIIGCKPQEFLRRGHTLEDLAVNYGVTAKRHGTFSNLVQLKYDQIESPMGEELVQQCRGIILDEHKDWAIVARPFDKFFNAGEAHAATIDWTTAKVQEKLDGSLLIMYFYRDKWFVATSGRPDARGEVNGLGMTFEDLFWKTFREMGFQQPSIYHNGYTFMFELMSPYNRIVVKHDKPLLRLIGVRDVWRGSEVPVTSYHMYTRVQEFNLNSMMDVALTFEKMDPTRQEGYVIVDRQFNRIKVKHPGYVAIHHMKDGFGPRRILELVRSCEGSEFITHFPEWKEPYDRVQAAYDGLVMHLETAYDQLKDIPEGRDGQKAFAMTAMEGPLSGVLFALRSGQYSSVKQGLKDIHLGRLIVALGLDNVMGGCDAEIPAAVEGP